MYLRENQVELHDEWWNSFGYPSYEGSFYDIEDTIDTSLITKEGGFSNDFYQLIIQPSKNAM